MKSSLIFIFLFFLFTQPDIRYVEYTTWKGDYDREVVEVRFDATADTIYVEYTAWWADTMMVDGEPYYEEDMIPLGASNFYNVDGMVRDTFNFRNSPNIVDVDIDITAYKDGKRTRAFESVFIDTAQ